MMLGAVFMLAESRTWLATKLSPILLHLYNRILRGLRHRQPKLDIGRCAGYPIAKEAG